MEAITIQRSTWIQAPRERVWQAVTDPAQVATWFAPGAVMSQSDDGIISVRSGEMDIDVAVVEVVDPPRQVTTRSLPDRLITTTYTLEEEKGGTRFTVTESGLELLSEDERQARISQNGKTWELALENLKAYIDGGELPSPHGFQTS
jgi:uncharacterized protein YndB with AHSA1/START domain